MRHLLSLLVLLGIGAMLSIAVAWTCVLALPSAVGGASHTLYDAPWPAPAPDEFPPTATIHVATQAGLTECRAVWRRDGAVFQARQYVLRAGWPRHCVYLAVNGVEAPGSYRFESTRRAAPSQWSEGVRLRWLSATKSLPIVPVWSGLAVNGVVFGLALAVMLFAANVMRGWTRRRHGKCVRCGYPVGVSSACTECGAAVCVRG